MEEDSDPGHLSLQLLEPHTHGEEVRWDSQAWVLATVETLLTGVNLGRFIKAHLSVEQSH